MQKLDHKTQEVIQIAKPLTGKQQYSNPAVTCGQGDALGETRAHTVCALSI